MAKHYGAEVLGIDLSDNMLAIANEHKREMSKEVQNLVTFRFLDATLAHFPAESFDVVYSRDAIMHIADKEPLYEKVLVISEFELKTSKSDIVHFCWHVFEFPAIFVCWQWPVKSPGNSK